MGHIGVHGGHYGIMLTTPWLLSLWLPRHVCGAMLLLLARRCRGRLARDFGLVLAARVRVAWQQALCNLSRRHHPYAFQPMNRAAPAVLAWGGAGPALGPSIGGLLVDWFGWRRFFSWWCRCAWHRLWLAYKFVPASAPGGVEPNRQGEALDWRGLLLGTVGTLCLLNGLVSLHGGSMAEAATLLAIAVVCVAAFHRLATPTHQRGANL